MLSRHAYKWSLDQGKQHIPVLSMRREKSWLKKDRKLSGRELLVSCMSSVVAFRSDPNLGYILGISEFSECAPVIGN